MNDASSPALAHIAIRTGERVDLSGDPRSVEAMLAGRDDGRAALYRRFHRKLGRVARRLDDPAIDAHFRRFELAARVTVIRLPRKWQPRASRWLMWARTMQIADAFSQSHPAARM